MYPQLQRVPFVKVTGKDIAIPKGVVRPALSNATTGKTVKTVNGDKRPGPSAPRAHKSRYSGLRSLGGSACRYHGVTTVRGASRRLSYTAVYCGRRPFDQGLTPLDELVKRLSIDT